MTVRIMIGDVREQLRKLPDASVHCVVTSPPYWGLRDYGVAGQIGLEASPAEFLSTLVSVFDEVWRVLRADGTCWVNMGDSYAGSWGAQSRGNASGEDSSRLTGGSPLSARQIGAAQRLRSGTGSVKRTPGLKSKDLVGMPWRLAFALQDAGWWLRQDIIWSKPNPMPESVRDRCTKAHEYIFLLSKSEVYYFDPEAIAEPCVWEGIAGLTNGVSFGHGSDAAARGRRRIKLPAGWDSGPGAHQALAGNYVAKRSGNKTRKTAAERGCPDIGGANVCGSVPWQGTTRNKRSVWTIAPHPFKEAHFATFAPAVPELCIKAGTSARGVCPHCGAPWKRDVTSSYINPGNRAGNGPRSIARRHESPGFAQRLEKESATTGWRPTCHCPVAEPVPATVLDHFFGAGTTGLVAERLQRDCIGIELNPAYAAMARRRIQEEAPLFADIQIIDDANHALPAHKTTDRAQRSGDTNKQSGNPENPPMENIHA